MTQNTPLENPVSSQPNRLETALLDTVEVRYGPTDVLGRFFLEADLAARARGVRLVVGDFSELAALNIKEAKNWPPLIPLFDPGFGSLSADNSLCLFARSENTDEIVAAHAVKRFDWTATNFKIEAESLRLFYADPSTMKLADESCSVTATSANEAVGTIVYSGAAWCRPDWRGKSLSTILPRTAKAWAYTTWNCDKIVSIMTRETHERGFAPRFGYTTVDWHVHFRNSRIGTRDFAYLAMGRSCLVEYVKRFLVSDRTTVTASHRQRTA